MTIEDLSVAIGADLSKLDKGLKDANKKLDGFSKGVESKSKGMSESFSGLGETLAAVFAVDQIKGFVTEMVRLTGQSQKFEAVLSNTLGSSSAAARSMGQIQSFAAKTNFSVTELTSGFVKLANQGFKPTTAEMTKLADLANSTGKQFDLLVEAIIDAQVGEFERLKEFGIRASKSGDIVKFSFKGVTTEVANTEKAIQGYILGLGALNGVQGATAKISGTLEGQVSNLGDAWETLLTTIGSGSSGAFSMAIGGLSNLLASVTALFETMDQKGKRVGGDFADTLVKRVEASLRMAKAEGDAIQKLNPGSMGAAGSVPGQADREKKRLFDLYQKADMERQRLQDERTSNPLRSSGLVATKSDQVLEQQIEAATAKAWAYKNALDQVDKIQADVMSGKGLPSAPPALGLLESLEKKAKELKMAMEKAPNATMIDSLAGQLEKVNSQIAALRESNELDRVNLQLSQLYATFADPTATDKALEGAKKRIAALEKEREKMEQVNEASLRFLMNYQKSIDAIETTKPGMIGPQNGTGTPESLLGRINGQKEIKPEARQLTAEEFAEDYKRAGGTVAEINSLIQGSMAEMIGAAASAFGQLATGVIGVEDVFSILLKQIANFAASFGQAMIAAGSAAIAAKALLTNPFTAIAAGVALVAAAGIISSAASNFGGESKPAGQRGGAIPKYENGTNYVPSNQLAFLHKGEAVVPAKLNPSTFGGMAQKAVQVFGEFKAVGRELRAVLESDNYFQMRTG